MQTGEKIQQNLEAFLRHIDAIRDTLPMTMLLIEPYNKKAVEKFVSFINHNVKEIEGEDKKSFLIKLDEKNTFETLERNAFTSSLAYKIIPESLFVSLISQYDAFLTRLLRAIYEIKPELLNGSERNLSFSQLIAMHSIEKAREYIIEKEIDTVLRKSHAEQFDYLEKLLSIKLRENLPIWSTFIEITERRNLLVHCDGVVSNHYIKNCVEHNCSTKEIKVGERIGVEASYFTLAYKCLYEIATKLSHTLWRKLALDDLFNADCDLNNICLQLINNQSFDLANLLLEFSCKQKKHHNDATKNIFIINHSLLKHLQGKDEEAQKILNTKDWSASSDNYKLAYAVITENLDEVWEIMIRIGPNGEVSKSDYKQWPLFSKIRKIGEFKDTYKSIFQEEYSIMETPMRPVQELIIESKKRNSKKPTEKSKTRATVDVGTISISDNSNLKK